LIKRMRKQTECVTLVYFYFLKQHSSNAMNNG
jgi:hypothetical protein